MTTRFTPGQLIKTVEPVSLLDTTGKLISFGDGDVFTYRGFDDDNVMAVLTPRGSANQVYADPRTLQNSFVSGKVAPKPGTVNRVSLPTRKAQIVDEQRFVEKAANILFAHADRIPWRRDTLNGGATQRAVVTRTDLTAWLSGDQETGREAAAPEAIQHLAEAASDDRGLRLLGTAFVLAELADFTRLGFAGRQPTLVLYRETPSDDAVE